MSGPLVHGWCPGALRPMMSGDGLVVRVRAPLGALSQEQIQCVADLSHRYGNGLIDLSARANLQIRGIREADHAALIWGLQEFGLVDQSVEVESRRNLMIQPFWKERDITQRMAIAVTMALAAPDAPNLPGKFGFAIDTGSAPILRGSSADIRLERLGGDILVRADESARGVIVKPDMAAQAAIDLAHWFLASGGAPEGRGRMARHLASGAVLPDWLASDEMAGVEAPAPGPGLHPKGRLIALEFGQIAAKTLLRLAAIGPLRLTPWRMLLMEGVTEAPDLPGLIHDATDPRLRIDVCTGAPGCPQGLSPTRDLARALAPHLPAGQSLHISGCAKGCAHPGPAALTLTATAPERFDLIRDGRADATPEATGLAPNQIKKAL
ncbi:precorrin-3B synthase [Nioella aestuarii]|uniref:precorrin-3B synthase n=1 Tax=Nioella aestuarii TaxID=1662864 RepID=UPI003D7F746E